MLLWTKVYTDSDEKNRSLEDATFLYGQSFALLLVIVQTFNVISLFLEIILKETEMSN